MNNDRRKLVWWAQDDASYQRKIGTHYTDYPLKSIPEAPPTGHNYSNCPSLRATSAYRNGRSRARWECSWAKPP